MANVYLAKLERFGYDIVAIGKTKAEARDAVLKEYVEAYSNANNGAHPKNDKFPYSDSSYFDVAKEELFVTPFVYGQAQWL